MDREKKRERVSDGIEGIKKREIDKKETKNRRTERWKKEKDETRKKKD